MNYLEELDLPALRPQDENAVANELNALFPQLEALNQNAQATAQLARNSTSQNQLAIIEELYRWNKQKMEDNNKMLHENIAKEADIKNALKKIEAGGTLHGSPDDIKNLQFKLKGIHERMVNSIEEVNLAELAKIKGLSKNQGTLSFNKLMIWVLEIFFGYPASKFYWPEFRKKAFAKDKGVELKRRMITYKYGEMTESEKLELREICDVHGNVIKDYFKTPEMQQFVDIIYLIDDYTRVYEDYDGLRKNGVENMDIQAVREEEDKVLKASARFNSVKYDVITEMQNVLFLVNHEFKSKRDE